MNDDKLFEKIKQSADSCEIPERLKPEHVEEMIGKKKRRGGRRYVFAVGGVATAVLVLVAVIQVMPNISSKNSSTEVTMDAASSEAATDNTSGGGSSDSKADAGVKELEEEAEAEVSNFSDVFEAAEDYDAVLKIMKESEAINYDYSDDEVMEAEDSERVFSAGAAESQEVADTAAADDGGSSNYSTTNLQVEGVDEGDIVKTDGEYIYIIQNNRRVRIVKVDGGQMEEIGTIKLEKSNSEESVQEIYLSDKKLYVITQGYGAELEQKDADTYYMDYRAVTNLYTYDMSKPKEPTLLGSVCQDGSYNTSRKVDGYVYLFTSFYPEQILSDVMPMTEEETKMFVPSVNDVTVAATDIYLPKRPQGCNYLVISAVDTNKPGEIVDKKAVLQDPGQFYISTKNIYAQCQNWGVSGDNTSIAKFSFEKGKITGVGAALVPGTITDTFAINEQNDYLRVLTTMWSGNDEPENFVTVLDQKMNKVGEIEGLAKGETIYSARFMGDIGYFVTYRNTDPLFSVDFSNPEEPKILGELKITGFSEYLHFYGENKLLGIGWETDPDTGAYKGLKLSMFDVSNPADVKEIDKTVVKNVDSFPGEYDYKALTVSPDKNVIGFITSTWGSRDMGHSYMVFSYEEGKGFENELTYSFAATDYSSDYENARGVYINDTFYLVTSDELMAFDMTDDYQKVGELD